MIKQISYNDCIKKWGDPSGHGGVEQIQRDLVTIETSIIFRPSNTRSILCHKSIADDLYKTLSIVSDIYSPLEIEKYGLNIYGGCYVNRRTKNGKWWSVHTWGLAVDMATTLGQYGTTPATPYLFTKVWLDMGWNWGGNWRGLRDGMHFSAVNEG